MMDDEDIAVITLGYVFALGMLLVSGAPVAVAMITLVGLYWFWKCVSRK